MDQPAERDPRVYFAAERTLLAWIRTGLGLIGVGFAVSRFGLFLREFAGPTASAHIPTSHSVISGVVLVALGVLVNLVAVINHTRTVHQLAAGSWQPGRPSRTAISLGVLLAVLGVVMAIYLLRIR